MHLKRIAKFSRSVTKERLPTQQAPLSQIVTGMVKNRSLILAEIAREFETVVKFVHNLKRAFRYVDNERVSQQQSKEVVAGRLIHQEVSSISTPLNELPRLPIPLALVPM
jgi:hypothetical protein